MTPTRSSWDRSIQEPSTPSPTQRHRLENVGEAFIDITPSRISLFQPVNRQTPRPETPTAHREELLQRALTLIGGPLRSPIANRHGVQHDRSGSQSSYTRSLNNPLSILLIDLPVDLLRIILDFLDWESLTTFRFTNKFFGELILVSNLKAHYSRCRSETSRDEEWLVKEGARRFTSRSLSGPMYGESLRAQALMGDMKRMPCYRCLRWFRCPTSKVLAESRKSIFSDMMAKPKDREGVDRYLTQSRLCYDCGVKTNYYKKGGQFKRFIICMQCGQLGQDLMLLVSSSGQPKTDENGKKLWHGKSMKHRYYCDACINSNKVPATFAEHAHEKGLMCKYERAMWKKREACKAKRKALGRERWDEKNPYEIWCPILERESVCNCNKWPEHRKEYFRSQAW